MDAEEKDKVHSGFNRCVNMAPKELEDRLET